MIQILKFFKDFDLISSCTLFFNVGVPCVKSDGRVRNCDRCQGMKRACYWAPDRRPTRTVKRRQAKKSCKKVGTSDEESKAVTTGGEEWPCKKAQLSAGGGIRTSSEACGLGEELKTQFACLQGKLIGMWGELVATHNLPCDSRVATVAPPVGNRSTMMWDFSACHPLR